MKHIIQCNALLIFFPYVYDQNILKKVVINFLSHVKFDNNFFLISNKCKLFS